MPDCVQHRYTLYRAVGDGRIKLVSANDVALLTAMMAHLGSKGWKVAVYDEYTSEPLGEPAPSSVARRGNWK